MGIVAADQRWMTRALELARQAAMKDEVPVGAVLVQNNAEIGIGHNQTLARHDCTAHAEIIALRDAGQRLQDYRFPEATLYTTLEPCAMCAGALLHARIKRVVYAAADSKAGAIGSVLDLSDVVELNHRLLVNSGLMADAAAALLKEFFTKKR